MPPNEAPRDTTSSRRTRRDPQAMKADKFVEIVAQGGTLADAHEATGLDARNNLVKVRLAELAIYGPLVKSEETRDTIANAVLMEKALDPETDTRDAINAAKALQKKSDQPLVEISLSEEILKLKPGKLFDDEGD